MRILVITALTALLGLSPLPHIVERALVQAGRASPNKTAKNLALVAEQLPWQTGLWERAGHYALTGDDFERAISYFKSAASRGDLSSEGYRAFGDAYANLGKPYTAIQIWKAGNHIFGPTVENLSRIAETQRELKDYPALIETLQFMLNLRSELSTSDLDLVEVYYELGMILAAEAPASAPPYLLRAVELDPSLKDAGALAFTIQRTLPQDNPTYSLMASGRKLASFDEWHLAAHAFKKATENQPNYAEAWAFLGEAQQHLDESSTTSALASLETALALDPNSLSANIFMALYWKRAGEHESSYEYLSTAARVDPHNPAILVDLGEATAILGDLDGGYHYYLEAVEQTFNNPAYLQALVKFCLRYNYRLEEIALPTARTAIRLDPENSGSLDVMGQLLFRFGDLLNAERFYLRALQSDPGYAPAYLHLGLLYNLQDKPEQAKEAFTRAIRLAPETATATLAERFSEIPNLP